MVVYHICVLIAQHFQERAKESLQASNRLDRYKTWQILLMKPIRLALLIYLLLVTALFITILVVSTSTATATATATAYNDQRERDTFPTTLPFYLSILLLCIVFLLVLEVAVILAVKHNQTLRDFYLGKHRIRLPCVMMMMRRRNNNNNSVLEEHQENSVLDTEAAEAAAVQEEQAQSTVQSDAIL